MRALLLLFLLTATLEARAERRFALVVGNNDGKRGQQSLRYAENDARRIAAILGSVGRFHPADVVVLTGGSAETMRNAFDDLERRMDGSQGSLLLVFYSGHADGAAINLGTTPLPLEELEDRLSRSSAAARILVIDACHSGVLTRVKGGWPGPSFDVPENEPSGAHGLAILASSAAREEAQESEELGASFFTHYFASGLLGAADRNGDLEVTLGETFNYAAERTLAATNSTMVGPQHATFRVELKGRHDVVLTSLAGVRDDVGLLEFSEAGGYLIEQAGGETRTIAEVALPGGQTRRLAVGTGRYRVTRRESDHLLVGEFEVRSDASTRVLSHDMGRIAYARMVRKGEGSAASLWSVIASGGVRTPLLDTGVAWRVGAGARYDLRELSLELRADVGGASHTTDRLRVTTRELEISLVGVRAFDVGPLTLELGAELGGVWFNQSFEDDGRARNSFGGVGGPLGRIELPIDRFSIRLEAAAPIYVVRVGNDPEQPAIAPRVTFRGSLSFGLYF